jgi:hypothetical protein
MTAQAPSLAFVTTAQKSPNFNWGAFLRLMSGWRRGDGWWGII